MSRKLKARLLAIPAFAISGLSHAAVPAAVTTAIETAGVDLSTVATSVLVSMVAFWALAKIGKKMGWW